MDGPAEIVPWQRLFGGGRDECLMRLIDSGSGIGHGYDAVTNLAPQSIVCSRGLRHLSAPPLSGTVGRSEMSTECGQKSKAAQPGTQDLGLASVWIEETSKRNTCVCVCVCSCD